MSGFKDTFRFSLDFSDNEQIEIFFGSYCHGNWNGDKT